MARGHAKGSQYERDFCRQLSEWWTYGRDLDCFWRTQGSGARVTSRLRKGQVHIPGQALDVAATNDKGKEFLKHFVISLKRGKCMGITIQDLIDYPSNLKPPSHHMTHWIRECLEISEAVGTSWMLVFKRDRRDAIFLMPSHIWTSLRDESIQIWAAPKAEASIIHLPFENVVPVACGKLADFFNLSPRSINCL